MTGNSEFVAAVDAFMAASKRLIGADSPLKWAPGRNQLQQVVYFPLEIAGEQPGPRMMVKAFPYSDRLKFRIAIIWPPAVCRLDYAEEFHPNSSAVASDRMPAAVNGPHFHSWEANRRFVGASPGALELHNAVPLASRGRSFDAILRWFCNEANIALPANHSIELPRPERLLV